MYPYIIRVSVLVYIFSCSIQPTWLRFSPIHVILWDIILLIRIFLNSRVICERMLQIDVLQYWFMLNAVRVTDNLNLIILNLSILFMWILLTTYFALWYSEVQGGQVVYQETSCMWILFHTTIGSHCLWVPLLLSSYIVSIYKLVNKALKKSWLQDLQHLKLLLSLDG